MNGRKAGIRRWVAGAAAAGVMSIVPVGVAFADDDPPREDYPPAATTVPQAPRPTVPIPKTGNDGTDTWVRLGAGAILAGGVLVVATSRRRGELTS